MIATVCRGRSLCAASGMHSPKANKTRRVTDGSETRVNIMSKTTPKFQIAVGCEIEPSDANHSSLDAKSRIIVAEGFGEDQAIIRLTTLITGLSNRHDLNNQDRNAGKQKHMDEAALMKDELQNEPDC